MRIPNLTAPDGAVVDIIVRAKNGHEMTAACIDSIVANTPTEAYRLILVDDGSEPPLECQAADFVIRNRESAGAVTATNLGLAAALTRDDSAYVLILDNDTRVPDGDSTWLARMIAELEEYPGTACVGATTNFANPPQHILASPQTYTADWTEPASKRSGAKENPAAPWFVSFAVLFRKAVLRQLGLWDEQYNPGNWEDTDYSVAVRVAGYQIRVARSVYIHHDGHRTFGDDLRRLLQVNGQKFHSKWGPGRLFDLGFISPQQMRAGLGAMQ